MKEQFLVFDLTTGLYYCNFTSMGNFTTTVKHAARFNTYKEAEDKIKDLIFSLEDNVFKIIKVYETN